MIRIAFAVFALCSPRDSGVSPRRCLKPIPRKARADAQSCASQVNLGAVPAICANVLASEPAPVVKRPTYIDPKRPLDEEPTLGTTKLEPGVAGGADSRVQMESRAGG